MTQHKRENMHNHLGLGCGGREMLLLKKECV